MIESGVKSPKRWKSKWRGKHGCRRLYRTEYALQLTSFRIEIRRIRNKFKIYPNILGRITVIITLKGKSKHKLV